MVRVYPVLCKLSDQNYKNNNIKENVRKDISIVIGKSGKSNTYQCFNVNNMLIIYFSHFHFVTVMGMS